MQPRSTSRCHHPKDTKTRTVSQLYLHLKNDQKAKMPKTKLSPIPKLPAKSNRQWSREQGEERGFGIAIFGSQIPSTFVDCPKCLFKLSVAQLLWPGDGSGRVDCTSLLKTKVSAYKKGQFGRATLRFVIPGINLF